MLKGCLCDEFSKRIVSNSIKILAQKNLLCEYCEEEILQVISTLYDCSLYEDNSKASSAEFVRILAQNGAFQNYSKQSIILVMNLLEQCCSENFAIQNIAVTIFYLSRQGGFSNFSENELQIVKNIFNICLEFLNTESDFNFETQCLKDLF